MCIEAFMVKIICNGFDGLMVFERKLKFSLETKFDRFFSIKRIFFI